jgi:hypothetical protein
VLASAEKRGQAFPSLRSETGLAEPDCVKAKRKRAITDEVLD